MKKNKLKLFKLMKKIKKKMMIEIVTKRLLIKGKKLWIFKIKNRIKIDIILIEELNKNYKLFKFNFLYIFFYILLI